MVLNLSRRAYRYCRIRIGEKLGLPVPKTYSMRIEWIKQFDKNPKMVTCADKVEAKDYVRNIIGDEYLIPTLGVYNSADEIDFEKLPEKFVLKTNNSSSTNIIVKDKSKLDIPLAKKQLDKWLKTPLKKIYGEWHYPLIKPKILCEEFIGSTTKGLDDYKFFCFNGKVNYGWIDVGRYTEHKARAIFDRNWNRVPMTLFTRDYKGDAPKPKNYDKMVEIAESLSKEFKLVRVDFYNIDGKIYFGEMTFFSGDMFFNPRKYDRIWGEKISLDS